MIEKLWHNQKLRELFAYGVVGASVTVLDIGLYALFSHSLQIPLILANVLAFVLANIYAFFANKLLVFHSSSFSRAVVLPEAVEFFSVRGASCLINSGLLYVGVNFMDLPDMPVKISANIIIIVLNYFFSKFVIFKKPKEQVNAHD